MTNLFYEIFNKKVELTPDVLKKFINEAEKLFNKFKVDNDIDNLRVLKNKIEHLLEDKVKNLTQKEKKEYIEINDFLDKIDDYLEELVKSSEKKELIDVVAELEKSYKKCDDIKEEDKHKYRKYCVKKSTVEYEKEIIELQVELLKLQKHIKETGQKLLIIFE
jgi:ElaB/YqjD/DUF883 family membrane-anchored ribosome-binding protein